MTELRSVRVAAVQATPVILDLDAPVAKAAGLIGEAAARGAELVVLPETAFPDDFPAELPDQDLFSRGGAAIVEPTWGELIAGPLYGEEGIVVADCGLRRGLHAKRWFDAVGHYSRADVLVPAAGRAAAPPAAPPPGEARTDAAG